MGSSASRRSGATRDSSAVILAASSADGRLFDTITTSRSVDQLDFRTAHEGLVQGQVGDYNEDGSSRIKHHSSQSTQWDRKCSISASRSFSNFSQSRNKLNSPSEFLSSENLLASHSKTYWPLPTIDRTFLPHFPLVRRTFRERYTIERLLERGAFGVVYEVRDEKDQRYALKTLSKSQIVRGGALEQVRNEVDIQTVCGHHPFIVRCVAFWQTHRKICLLTEYACGGELFARIRHFSIALVQLYVLEIAIAIDFLHNAGIVYRDLKPENILIDRDCHVKLVDFGLSKWLKIGQRTHTICGTLQYMVFELSMEGRQVDEVVSSIFHTIMFHRSVGKFTYSGDTMYSIGTVGHMDVDCDFVDFTYVCCSSPSLERDIRREIANFSEQLRSNDSTSSGQISLEFFQRKRSRWPFQPECTPWEVWTVRLEQLSLSNEDQRQVVREQVSEMLTDKILYITDVMNRPDYVPKMPSRNELENVFDTSYEDVQPYLYKFKFNTSGPSASSVGTTVKKLIKETLSL